MSRYKIVDEDGIYFTTHTIVEWMPVFRERKYFEIIVQSLRHCQEEKGLTVFGYVIMLTHFHLVAKADGGTKFHEVMRDMKKFTSKEISRQLVADGQKLFLYVFMKATEGEKGRRKYKVWQEEYHPQIIYSDSVCYQKLEYMHNNPLRKGFVERPEDWVYGSARNYVHDDHSILKVELLQMI
jgi:REP element-mobilizing transposase RayT